MATYDKSLIGDSQDKEWRNFDKQLLFDGLNDRVQTIELTQDVRVGKSFTAAMWVKSNSYNNTLFTFNTSYLFYAYSTNNLSGLNELLNEITFFYASPTSISISVICRMNGLESNITGVGGVFDVLNLGEVFHLCITNNWDGNENNWKLYLNGNKILQGVSIRVSPFSPPNTGINLSPDPNYICGMGYAKNRETLAVGYMNNSLDEVIFANVAITDEDVRKLFHCSAGDYANYPANLMSNRILHLPMNNVNDFIDNGIGNPISVKNLATGGDAILTGQNFPPTLTNFY